MSPVVCHPSFTQNLEAELRPFEVAGLSLARKGMSGRAEADDRLARIQEAHERC